MIKLLSRKSNALGFVNPGVVFFLSSRRRHTRYWRDWSSDVCSSDLLTHGIARLRHSDPEAGPFSERYVFPDAAPLHLSRVEHALEAAGLITEHVEGFAADYARTLTEWLTRLEANLGEAVRLAGPERVRVWRLYLRAARNGFQIGFTSVYQVLALRPTIAT